MKFEKRINNCILVGLVSIAVFFSYQAFNVYSEVRRSLSQANIDGKINEYSAKAILDLLYSNDPYRSATLPALVANDSALGFEGNGQSKL